jgi:hypothetical protein
MPPEKKKKQHRARQSGTKADKKQAKKDRRSGKGKVKGQNPKAFGRSSAGITARIQQSRKAEIQERKLHAPLIDRSYAAEEPPPIVVGVVVSEATPLRTAPSSVRCSDKSLRPFICPAHATAQRERGNMQNSFGVLSTTVVN